MVRDAIEKLGRLDYLANNAGTSATVEPIPPHDFDRLNEEFWATILTTNLIGPFRCTRAAAPALQAAGGAVCNTASVAGINMPGSSMAYGASKAGLISLTKNLARALAPQARVNAVAPGFVDTEWTKRWPGRAQAGVDRAHAAQARLHARGHRRRNRVPVRRHQHGHGADAGGGRRLFVLGRSRHLALSARASEAARTLQAAPVERGKAERGDIDVVEAAHVERDHLAAVRRRSRARTTRPRKCGQNRWWIALLAELIVAQIVGAGPQRETCPPARRSTARRASGRSSNCSVTTLERSAVTSKRTSPQWQPPV